MYFFALKAFTRLLKNFFEICRRGGCSILIGLRIIVISLSPKCYEAGSQRRKAAAFSKK